MKAAEFRVAVDEEFGGAHGRVLVHELVLDALGGRTAAEALDAGASPREVWQALCAANDVPVDRWHGRGRPAERR